MSIRHGAIGGILLLLPLCAPDRAEASLNEESCNIALSVHFSIPEKIAKCDLIIHAGGGRAIGEQRAVGYYNRGLLHHMAHDYELAIADYTSAMGWKPNFEDAVAARADAYEDLGQHEKAAADYAQAAAMRADGPVALAARCWARAARGRPLDRALADCNAALSAGADETETRFLRCFVNYRLARYADAIQDCANAEAARPRFAAALYIGGISKLRVGDTAGGNADIATALDADRQIADTWALYGVHK